MSGVNHWDLATEINRYADRVEPRSVLGGQEVFAVSDAAAVWIIRSAGLRSGTSTPIRRSAVNGTLTW